MQQFVMHEKNMTQATSMPVGQDQNISVESFKVLLEMFSEAIVQLQATEAWRPGDAQLAQARNIILEFYDYQDDRLPSVAVEMFNDRLVGNLRNGAQGELVHSQYQPSLLVHYAREVVNWGLVCGLVAVPDHIVLH